MDYIFNASLFLATIILILLLILWQLNKRYGYIEDLGIPVLPSKFFLGTPPFNFHKTLFHEHDLQCFEKFKTKTYGRYDGIQPTIVTKDPELMKAVMVKHFDAFTDRENYTLPDEYLTLDIAGGESWKTLRKGLSPMFKSGKIKQMVKPITEMADRLLAHIGNQCKNGDVVDVRPLLQGYAFDVIGKCAYGADFNIVTIDKVEKPMIMKATQAFVDEQTMPDWGTSVLWNIFNNFPMLFHLFPTSAKNMFEHAKELAKVVMNKRNKKNAPYSGDFMDLLRTMSETIKASGNSKHEGVTEDMVFTQGVIFLAAGFETTATTMAILLFNLARNPDVQTKCWEEIQYVLEEAEKIDHETVSQLKFLECCILETLRLAPPLIRTHRVCNKMTNINGLTIKPGTVIHVPTYALHRDKDFFGDDADTFNPNRFLAENGEELSKRVTFHAFGLGPRVCIGKRFAMIEMKITVAKILQGFVISEIPGVTKLNFKSGSPLLLSFDETKVRINPRIH